MSTVIRISKQGKVRPVRRRVLDSIPAVDDRASLVALIQAVSPLGLQAVADVLQQEVPELAGARYSRTGGQLGYVRWCRQRGSVYLLDQKLPITYTRAGIGSETRRCRCPPIRPWAHPGRRTRGW